MGVPRVSTKTGNNNTSLSCCKHGEKRVQRSKTTFGSLPKELLVDVLARVASSSFDYLFDAKLICKEFMEAAEDDYISEHISINKFRVVTEWLPLNDKLHSFLTKCFNKGNPDALFRRGMIEYFKLANVELGVEYFKRATEKKHLEATYVYGMLLLAQGDDQSIQHGLNVLNSIKRSKQQNWNMEDCRDKIESILRELWINNPINLKKVNTKCKREDHVIRFQRRCWRFDEDEELASCETCSWYRELVYFGKMMNLIV